MFGSLELAINVVRYSVNYYHTLLSVSVLLLRFVQFFQQKNISSGLSGSEAKVMRRLK